MICTIRRICSRTPPCNGTLMLWFDIDMGDNHDRMFDTVLKFIEQCIAEVLGSGALSLETMLTSK